MKYAHDSMIVTVAPEEFKKIQNRLKFYDDQFKAATTKDTEFAKLRDSQVFGFPQMMNFIILSTPFYQK